MCSNWFSVFVCFLKSVEFFEHMKHLAYQVLCLYCEWTCRLPVILPPHFPSSSLFRSHSTMSSMFGCLGSLSQWGLAVQPNLSIEAFLVSPTCLLATMKPASYSPPIGSVRNGKASKRLGMRNRNEESRKGLGKMSVCNMEFIIFPFVSFFLFPTHLLF